MRPPLDDSSTLARDRAQLMNAGAVVSAGRVDGTRREEVAVMGNRVRDLMATATSIDLEQVVHDLGAVLDSPDAQLRLRIVMVLADLWPVVAARRALEQELSVPSLREAMIRALTEAQ